MTRSRGASPTGWLYTWTCHGFGVPYQHFWYMDGWVSVTDPMRPICQIGCILEKLGKIAPNMPQIGCFLRKIWIWDTPPDRICLYLCDILSQLHSLNKICNSTVITWGDKHGCQNHGVLVSQCPTYNVDLFIWLRITDCIYCGLLCPFTL